jgi:selenocysteine lyase/cysteine desulfurase
MALKRIDMKRKVFSVRTTIAAICTVPAASREVGALVEAARGAVADLLGAGDPDEIVFGSNMTTLTFALSQARFGNRSLTVNEAKPRDDRPVGASRDRYSRAN